MKVNCEHCNYLNMAIYRFTISITAEAWLDFYRRPKSSIVATDVNGRTIQLAARHFQRFVTRDGVRGLFELTLSDANDFVDLQKVR